MVSQYAQWIIQKNPKVVELNSIKPNTEKEANVEKKEITENEKEIINYIIEDLKNNLLNELNKIKIQSGEEKEEEKPTRNQDEIIEILRDLKLKVYYLDGCGYCKLFKETLKPYTHHKNEEIIELRDATKPNWTSILKELNISGFPTTVSEKTKKQLIGYVPSIDTVINHFLKD